MTTQTPPTTKETTTMTTTITDLNGDFTISQLVSLRDTRIAWSGEPDREYERAVAALCDDALAQIGQDGDAIGVEITAGKITSLIAE